MMPSLASISCHGSFFNVSNDMSFGSSVVSSFGASFAVGGKSADLDTIRETIEKIGIEDGSSDLESDHRPPGRISVQMDNSSGHWKKGERRWDASDSSHKKDSTPMIIRR
jgi:hypothetical protein